MGCCTSQTTGAGAVAVETNKRVNYTQGMLLGVDDFVQEQAWHTARRHELAREVLGYGTVRGLQVSLEPGGGRPRVRVAPGLAYTPSGAPVCVGSEQCCDINDWLQKHWAQLPASVNGPVQPAPLRLYVVLSYLAVPVDPLPVPGEPCRDEAGLTANSRLADCFKLELRGQPPQLPGPPPQVEENAIRDFADWLAQVPVGSSSPPLGEAEFLAQLRAAAIAWLQPVSPNPADFMFGSPPPTMTGNDALLRTALRLWVTELRPLWRARYGCGPLPAAPGGEDDAVLLAALDLRVYHQFRQAEPDPRIVEDQRPVLLSLRMVQELVTQNPAPEAASTVAEATSFGQLPLRGLDLAYARADHHHGTPTLRGDAVAVEAGNPAVQEVRVRRLDGVPLEVVAPLQAGQLLLTVQRPDASLAWRAVQAPAPGDVNAQTRFGQPSDRGSGTAYAAANHTHGTPSLQGDVEAVDEGTPAVQRARVRGLQGVPIDGTVALAVGQVLTLQRFDGEAVWRPVLPPAPPAVPVPGSVTAQTRFGLPANNGSGTAYAAANHTHGTPPLEGDLKVLDGAAPDSPQRVRVVALQGLPVSEAEPTAGKALMFNGSEWAPADPPSGGTAPVLVLGGDLRDTLGNAFIQRLQRVPVKAQTPQPGDVLTFNGEFWAPSAAPAGGAGMAIETVAAGSFELDLAASPNDARTLQSAGNDSAKLVDRLDNQAVVEIIAQGIADADGPRKGFTVKLTPVWNVKQPVLVYLGTVEAVASDSLRVEVVVFSERDFIATRVRVQYEISRYQPYEG